MNKVKILFQSVLVVFIFACSNKKEYKYPQILKLILDQYPMYVKISPDGNKVLLKNRSEENFELLISDIPMSELDTIDSSDFTQLSLTWHPNEKEIIFQELNPKTRKYDLYKVDITSKKRTLVGLPASKNAIPPLKWSKNGTYLSYLVTDEMTVLHIYDYGKKEIIRSFPNASIYSGFQWSGDTTIFFIENPKEPMLKQINIVTGKIAKYDLLKNGEVTNFSVKESKVLYIGREDNMKYFQCYELNMESGDIKKMIGKNFNISSCRYSNNDSIFYYSQNENGIDRLYCSDSSINNSIQDLGEISNCLQIDLEQENKLYFTHQTLCYPPQLLQFDIKNLKQEVIYKPLYAEHLRIEKPDFLEIESEEYNSKIPGYFWKSDSLSVGKKAVIYVHGGPLLQSKPLWDMRTKLLNNKGFSVLSINYHGSSGYTQEFALEKDEFNQVLDIVASVHYIKSNYNIREENIILIGSSYGGKLVLKACDYLNDIGGIVLISGTITNNTNLQKLRKIKLYGFYGDMDPLSIEAITFFEKNGLKYPKKGNLILFKNEGHFFHKSSSWASVYGKLIESFSMED